MRADAEIVADTGIVGVAVSMVRRLRSVGVAAPPDASVAFATALAEVGLTNPAHVYWAGRATLVHRPEDVADYDRVFASTFQGRPLTTTTTVPPEPVTLLVDGAPDDDQGSMAGDGPPNEESLRLALRWSDREVLRRKNFATCTPIELDEIHRLMAQLRMSGSPRRSRRSRPTSRARGAIDLRATTRRALRTGGEPLHTVHRRPGERLRSIVLLCDVSGSMEAYARALVRFAHASVVGRARVEVFTLGTRCTRITRELRTRDPDAALAAAATAVADWSGGTRLGTGLRDFNDAWGVRGLARGADVVVLSDGWDRGDPDVLAQQVCRLRRVAHRLIWVNPLKASPGFAPLARGMAAALPHVDELVEGHSLRSLEELAEVLAR